MTCSRYQDQLLLCFGQERLPRELQEHLAECESCQAVWKELRDVDKTMGGDNLFYPNDSQVEQLVLSVNKAVEKMEQGKRHFAPWARKVWLSYVPAVAAAALVLGFVLGGYMVGEITLETKRADVLPDESISSSLSPAEYGELNESAVGILIHDFTAQHTYEASEWLLDDLTDEELRYLEKNLQVKDLL